MTNTCLIFLDRLQVIPMLHISLSYTYVIDWHLQYEVLFAEFTRSEYFNIFAENPVTMGFQKFTC